LPQVFKIDLPEALIKEVERCKNNTDVRALGVEWCIQQSKELLAAGAPSLHYYSMGKSNNIKAIATKVF
jgi:methylenetetrahydrofolate reductase (NADPH)